MAKIEKFEDLECWKEARILVKQVFLEVQDNNKVDWDTKSQIRRATLSIMNNIAEGFGRYSDKEFIRFLEYSSSSAAEVRSMLYVFEDLNFTDLEELKTIQEQLDKTRKLTLGLIRYLKNKKP
ncbi:MAG: four helix bundle protein [Reichenbachiella sp.]|uniref:four helix bundle protein n=1 Tax=Reichenbachiella sp. TaxID=2184521 RepID=UPI002966B327|nr:four helix bundle protein [Reichenbachiella sp.]MDW3209960.1 four helix bundle protein [Reichenbachiella sp.]